MKSSLRIAFFCCLAWAPLFAQLPTTSPVDVIRRPGWSKEIFIGGGSSVDSTPSGQNLLVGFRIGRVLTHEIGRNALRGTLEMAADVVPLDEYWIHGAQYAAGINPLIVKWNFTSPRNTSPYLAVVEGVLFSPRNLPSGDTAQVNFTSGAELGVQMFRKDRRSIDLAVKAYHLSNASLGKKNPGINASLQFMLGYTWH
jgi:lipid A 3-O-deacylase